MIDIDTPNYTSYEAHKARYNAEQEKKNLPSRKSLNVIVKGVDIPFLDLVVLLVKVALAAIPAGFIVMIVWATLFSFLGKML